MSTEAWLNRDQPFPPGQQRRPAMTSPLATVSLGRHVR